MKFILWMIMICIIPSCTINVPKIININFSPDMKKTDIIRLKKLIESDAFNLKIKKTE